MRAAARVAAAVCSALLGIALCIAAIRFDEALHLLPRLPTPGGEDDFSVRASLFFGLTCPAFAALGGYLGWLGAVETSRAARAWLGVVLGTVLCFALVAIFPSAMLRPARGALGGNGAFGLFLATWVVVTAVLARVLGKRRT